MKSRNKIKKIMTIMSWMVFFIYLFLLTYFLFFADLMGRTHVQENYAYNLELFKEIRRFIRYYKVLGWRSTILNLGGNVIGFMPMGFMLPMLIRRAKHWYLTVLMCFTFSLLVETVQLIWRVGIFDVDDMFLNTLGGLLGYLVYRILAGMRKDKNGN